MWNRLHSFSNTYFKIMKQSIDFSMNVNSKTRKWFLNGFNTFQYLLSMKVVKANKLCYWFFLFSLFYVFQVSIKAPKRNYNITFKRIYANQFFSWLNGILHVHTAVSCWYVQSLAFCGWEICSSFFFSSSSLLY